MCGRLDQHEKQETYAAWIDALVTPRTDAWRPRWNLPATEPVLFGVPWQGERRLGLARFGWPNPVGKGMLLNARREKLTSSPFWGAHLAAGRCIVPVNGWWEWSKQIGYRPIANHLAVAKGPSLLAGLWRQQGDDSLVVIVTDASWNSSTAMVHDRIPITLRPDEAWRWATAPVPEALEVIASPRPSVEFHVVGAAVGSVKAEGPELANPVHVSDLASLYAKVEK